MHESLMQFSANPLVFSSQPKFTVMRWQAMLSNHSEPVYIYLGFKLTSPSGCHGYIHTLKQLTKAKFPCSWYSIWLLSQMLRASSLKTEFKLELAVKSIPDVPICQWKLENWSTPPPTQLVSTPQVVYFLSSHPCSSLTLGVVRLHHQSHLLSVSPWSNHNEII